MTVGRSLLLLGFVGLAIVVVTHVAEKLNAFPGMGRGLPDSPGHYLDLVSAAVGSMLLISPAIAHRPLPAPWSFKELDACFVVHDHSGQKLAYVYFEDEPGRRSAAKLVGLISSCPGYRSSAL